MKLTLGVLADIEEHFEIDSIDSLPNSGKAILWVIEHMAKAAGAEVTQAELRAADIDLATFIETLGALSGANEADPKKASAPSA
jgi:hypothetical protein